MQNITAQEMQDALDAGFTPEDFQESRITLSQSEMFALQYEQTERHHKGRQLGFFALLMVLLFWD